MKRRVLFITAFCLYIGAILYLCLTKPEELPQVEFTIFGLPADKVGHLLMFIPFPALSYSMLWKKGRSIWMDMLIFITILATGVGIAFATEELQAMTQYRTPDINDVYADSAGLFAGGMLVVLHLLIKTIRKIKSRNE